MARFFRWDKRPGGELESSDKSDTYDLSDSYEIKAASPDLAANTVICLINQALFLLRKQLSSLGRQFIQEGGFTDRMYRYRNDAKS